ncbi:hypothetical protein QBC43DRAFT_327023 [Cladorrhinum sp. PSN259]|nr:hypothetical protein QBC43DRAFT_327023 [Cladorrhinum sp. PSN259]
MCLHDPTCPLWPGYKRAAGIRKRARPPSKRLSNRASRTKLQDALLQCSKSNTILKRATDSIPRGLLNLQPSDKLSNHPHLVRDILARALAYPLYPSKKGQEQFLWDSLLAILEWELPSSNNTSAINTASPPIWSSKDAEIIRKGSSSYATHADIVLDPIWDRFPGKVSETRALIADAFLSPAVCAGDYKLVELLLSYGAQRDYSALPHGYPSALVCATNEAPPRDESQARILFTLLMPLYKNSTRGEGYNKQVLSPEVFEKVTEYWSSEEGREMKGRMMPPAGKAAGYVPPALGKYRR